MAKSIYKADKFKYKASDALKNIESNIEAIKIFPQQLKEVLKQVNKSNRQNSYRTDGWTIEQIVHHLADAHLNAFIRFKLTLTESTPIIKPYDENLFAETPEIFIVDLNSSVQILSGLHKRWSILLENMDLNDFKQTFIHPCNNNEYDLVYALALYAWHGTHHLEQIKFAINNNIED